MEQQNKFTIICNKCASTNVEIYFYSGYIYGYSGDLGSMDITCKDCCNKLEGEEIE